MNLRKVFELAGYDFYLYSDCIELEKNNGVSLEHKIVFSGESFTALTELEQIKASAEEVIAKIKRIDAKTYTVIAMPADDIIKTINHIVKGDEL